MLCPHCHLSVTVPVKGESDAVQRLAKAFNFEHNERFRTSYYHPMGHVLRVIGVDNDEPVWDLQSKNGSHLNGQGVKWLEQVLVLTEIIEGLRSQRKKEY